MANHDKAQCQPVGFLWRRLALLSIPVQWLLSAAASRRTKVSEDSRKTEGLETGLRRKTSVKNEHKSRVIIFKILYKA